MKLRWGILSTANIGQKVKAAIDASENGVVVAVASRSLKGAEDFRTKIQKPGDKVGFLHPENDAGVACGEQLRFAWEVSICLGELTRPLCLSVSCADRGVRVLRGTPS